MRYTLGYIFMGLLLFVVLLASLKGWGLGPDEATKAQSVRTGSVRVRSFGGGGPGSGK
jgi:hypothetical protein